MEGECQWTGISELTHNNISSFQFHKGRCQGGPPSQATFPPGKEAEEGPEQQVPPSGAPVWSWCPPTATENHFSDLKIPSLDGRL